MPFSATLEFCTMVTEYNDHIFYSYPYGLIWFKYGHKRTGKTLAAGNVQLLTDWYRT